MPILGSDGSTAVNYGGNNYISTPQTPTKPTPFDQQWSSKPAPAYKPPKPPMGKLQNIYNPTPSPTAKKTAFDNTWSNPKPAAKPAPRPKPPIGKLQSIYQPLSQTIKPTAFDNQWNPTLNRPVGSVPMGKLNNLFNPLPNPSIGAKTPFDLVHQNKPVSPSPYEKVDWTHGSVFDNLGTAIGQMFNPDDNRGYVGGPQSNINSPTQLAGKTQFPNTNLDPSVWNEIKNFITPQYVGGQQSDLQAPTQVANNVAPPSNNYNIDPLLYTLGGLGDMVGLGPDNKDQKSAPQSVLDSMRQVKNEDSGMSPYSVPNGGGVNGVKNAVGAVGQGLQNWWNSSDKPIANDGSSKPKPNTPASQAADILKGYTVPDGHTGVMITQPDGTKTEASKFDIENNPQLAAQFVQLNTPMSSQTNAPTGVSSTGVPMGKLNALYNPIPDPATSQPTTFDKHFDPKGAAQMGAGITPASEITGKSGTVIPASQFGSGAGAGYNAENNSMGGGSMPVGGLPAMGGSGAGLPTDPNATGGSSGGNAGASGGVPSFLQLDLTPEEKQSLMTWANSQALLQNNVQRNSLDLQKNQQMDAYNTQIGQLKNQETSAENQLENQSFQNYLDSRQQIADRGLASSGLANDANTRLMLDRDQQLGQLQRQNDASMSSALATQNTNLANIAAQRSQINDQVTANNLYNQLYQSRLQMQQQANQLAEDWAKWNTTSGNYAYRFGVSAQNAQLSAATKLQVAQMSDQMKLATNDASNSTRLQIANGNLNAKLAQINSMNWNYGQQQYISMAKDLGTQAAAVLKQIPNAASPQEQQQLLAQYNNLTASMAENIGYAQDNANSGFNNVMGGSGANSAQVQAFSGNTPKAYQQQLGQVVQAGYLPADQVAAFNEIIKLESGFDPNIKNKHSSAYGYGQFLDSTRAEYEKKMGMSYNNPVNQLAMTAQYIKDRYGSAQNALQFHLTHGWY